MNKWLMVLIVPIALVWLFLLAKIGANGFTVFFGIIGSILWLVIVGGIVDGITKAKGEMYLANKYDEEKNKNKNN